eukprot:3398923-Rhodomonas_salina.2
MSTPLSLSLVLSLSRSLARSLALPVALALSLALALSAIQLQDAWFDGGRRGDDRASVSSGELEKIMQELERLRVQNKNQHDEIEVRSHSPNLHVLRPATHENLRSGAA